MKQQMWKGYGVIWYDKKNIVEDEWYAIGYDSLNAQTIMEALKSFTLMITYKLILQLARWPWI